MNWTGDQNLVINTRNSNILVSAAAGSGKTAVLVARILERILNPKDPINIDELLIVTFTKAAAGEMRERIRNALQDEAAKQPDNAHLARQSVLIHNAQITTIDGFCSYIIRNYAHVINLAPGFRVAEEGEAKLLRSDVCREVIEEGYAEEDEEKRRAFHEFVETFASGKSDYALEGLLIDLYEASASHPSPGKWLKQCEEDNSFPDQKAFFESRWMQEYLKDAVYKFETIKEGALELLKLTELLDGPQLYRPNAEAYTALSEELEKAGENYSEIRSALMEFDPPALSRKKAAPEENPALREQYKNTRDRIKAITEELSKEYFILPEEEAYHFQKQSAGALHVLIRLTEKLRERYKEEKEKRNLMDFSDLEHNALQILRNDNGERSFAAIELSERFREVMIDEYQDSNYLQEAILTAVSRIDEGDPNYFCVGDVKQSIYSFRQARPELFMEKFDRYEKNPETGTRIDLHMNFRSGRDVVDTVNGIFYQIMRREIGGVEYDEKASLVKGADYPDLAGLETEVIPVLLKDEDPELLSDVVKNATAVELEARAVGSRILKMVGREEIFDLKRKVKRKIEYRDIVILLRSTKNWSESFVRVLESMRIPVYSEAKQGYFHAMEVNTVLNYLQIVDNPQQDIPFTSVLKSPFVSLSVNELTLIRTADIGEAWTGSRERSAVSMYDAARAYSRSGEEMALRHKLEEFFSFYDEIRGAMPITPLHELIYRIIHKSGYYDYVSALPGGLQRTLNLRMLIDKAISYENTSYIGLFNFIRYINQMKDQELDFGELSSISESENVVRIYSIHKSKGLEYPVVFLSGMSKKFNMMDLNKMLLTHPDLGIASDYIDTAARIKAPTLRKTAIRNRKKKDLIGEELRILYVALTRAKQKLILTGSMKDQETLDDLYLDLPLRESQLPVGFISSQNNYFHWVIPAVKRMIERGEKNREKSCVMLSPVKPSDLAVDAVEQVIYRKQQLETLKTLKPDVIYDGEMRQVIDNRFSYQYPYQGREAIPIEVSVSELKTASYQDREEEFSEESNFLRLYESEEEESLVPKFMRETSSENREADESGEEKQINRLTGARRGTAYHRVMEVLDMKEFYCHSGKELKERLKAQLSSLLQNGKLTEEEYHTVWMPDVLSMLESPLGQRMIAADRKGCLYREQPFVLGVSAEEINPDWPSEEMIFVQGIIDAFFYEHDQVVLVDYKTDYVTKGAELGERYHVQIEQYTNALERVTGRKVEESYLWSFRLGEAVRMQ